MEKRRGIECIQQDQKMGQLSSLDLSYLPRYLTLRSYLYLSVISRMEIPIIESEIPITRDTEHGTPSPNSQPP